MEQLTRLRTTPVSELMDRDIVVIEGSAPVSDAIQLMKRHNKTSIIIKPRNDQDAYGILTEKDILEKVIDPGEDIHRDPWNTQVHSVMSKPVISVHSQMSLKYALRLMKRVQTRRLGVMEGEKLVGVLTETDILHAVEELPGSTGQAAL